LLTSAAPGAGKSFTAINLAVVMAQSGQRVCLIDGDMRRGQLRRYFGLSKQTEGLAELLAGTHTLSAVLKPGMVENLSFIATGKTPPNPSELLMRHTFAQALQELNTQFDTIIVDAPPVLAVTDPIVIGRTIGTVLMIVRHMQTPIGEVEAVRKAFETTGTKITGVILNGYRAAAARKLGAKQAYSNYRYSYKPNKD
jgi:tyrosine-protein kinase Etk/Wzc